MTQATVTWGVVEPYTSSFSMNDCAISTLNRVYTVPQFGDVDQPSLDVERWNSRSIGVHKSFNKSRGMVSERTSTTTASNENTDDGWQSVFKQLGRYLDDREYEKRIALLMEEAKIEEVDFNNGALQAFWSFVGTGPRTRFGFAFFTDDGDVAVEWRTSDENHFEIRFLDHNRVNYVFFNRQPGETHVSIGHGTEVLATIRQRIISSGFRELVFY